MEMPKAIQDLVGTRQTFEGGLFSNNKSIEATEFEILKWRWGSGYFIDINNPVNCPKRPTVQFLVKNESMKRSRWTRSFPVNSIDLRKEGYDD